MSTIPSGWKSTTVMISNTGPVYSVELKRPVNNVVFARVVSAPASTGILCIDGLNRHQCAAVDSLGGYTTFDYLFNASRALLAYEDPVIPGPSTNFTGQNLTRLDVTWKTINNAISVINTITTIELELWSTV